jgi:hypothetical protein
MQATDEFFMQQFDDIVQHALFDACFIMQRLPLVALLTVIIITTLPAQAADYDQVVSEHDDMIGLQSVDTSEAAYDLVSTPAAFSTPCAPCFNDQTFRAWLVSTRYLSADIRCANVHSPTFRVARLDDAGNQYQDSLPSLFSQLVPGRPLVIHVHGNRMWPAGGLHDLQLAK